MLTTLLAVIGGLHREAVQAAEASDHIELAEVHDDISDMAAYGHDHAEPGSPIIEDEVATILKVTLHMQARARRRAVTAAARLGHTPVHT